MVRRPAVVALFLVGVLGVLAGCYDVPKPVCGFYCGPEATCPDDYACQRGRCILNSALATLDPDDLGASCELVDAGVPPQDVETFDTPVGPTVVDHVPHDLDDDVAIDTVIAVTFSEPVTQLEPGSITVFEQSPSNPVVAGTITQPTSTTAVFTPAEPLAMGAAYAVYVSSPIADLDGFPVQFTQWSFKTVPDTVPPTIVARTPAPDATDVPIDTWVVVEVSERVNGVDNSTFVVRTGGQQVAGIAFYDDTNHTVTFAPDRLLASSTTYEVAMSGAITDRGNNPLAGAPITWTFTTGPDTIPPHVILRTPAPGATDVYRGDQVIVRFDEDVVNVSDATFTLRAGSTVIPATVSYVAGVSRARLLPTAMLGSNVTYTVTLAAGITDLAGNPLADAPMTWTFTTEADTDLPAVIDRTPAQGANNVSPDAVVTATFSEDVTGVSGATFTLAPGGGVVTYDAAQHKATLIPSASLELGTTYTATLTSGITDLVGNPLVGTPVTWSFTTTTDATAPTASLLTPANGATGVATTTPIVVRFSEPVVHVDVGSFRVNAPAAIAGAITQAGVDYTFTPDAPLPAGATVSVGLKASITDATGNALVPVTYSFTTAP